MSFFDNWKEFLIRAEREKYSTASQAAFYWITARFNEANWADEINLTDSELMRLTQIRSSKTIADVKSRLKLSGVIDFRTSKHYGTTYKLVQLASTAWNSSQGKGQGKEQSKGQSKGQLISYTPKISKKEDEKTERLNSPTTTTAHAMPLNKLKLSEEVRHCWIENTGINPFGEAEKVLAELEKTHGALLVRVAIMAAKRRGDGTISPNFLEATLEKVLAGIIKYQIDDGGKIVFPKNTKGEIKSNGRSESSNDKKDAWDY